MRCDTFLTNRGFLSVFVCLFYLNACDSCALVFVPRANELRIGQDKVIEVGFAVRDYNTENYS